MAIVNDIYAFLNEIAPVRYQMDFDNAGFLVGDGGTAVKKTLLALDITDDVIAEAVSCARSSLFRTTRSSLRRCGTRRRMISPDVRCWYWRGTAFLPSACTRIWTLPMAVLMMRSWRHWMRRSRAVWNRPVRQLTGARLPADASGS